MSAFPLRSCESLSNCFQKMFLDSKIVQNVSLGRAKCSNIQTYGIFPIFFFPVLMDENKHSDHYAVSFNESMNKVTQDEQINVRIQFWIELTNLLESRYLKSVF